MKISSLKQWLTALAITASAIAGTILPAVPALARPDSGPGDQGKPAAAEPVKEPAKKESVGPSADTIHPYRPAGKDPFKMTIVKPPSKVKEQKPVGFPPFEMRRAEYRQLLARRHAADMPEPSPLKQYLVSELTVLGIFSDSQGPGAFVKAQPTGTTFFIRQGAECYNGQVLRVESDPGDLSGARVVFKEKMFTDQHGKQVQTERVVAKAPSAQEQK